MPILTSTAVGGASRPLPYAPDYAVPPGETLAEWLEEAGMTQVELARRMNRPEKTINEIIKGKAAITAETAAQLERVTAIAGRLWLRLEQDYRAALVRQDEREALSDQVAWVNDFPYSTLVQRGLIADCSDPVDRLVEVLRFFGVASIAAWQAQWANTEVAYHHAAAFTSSDKALAAWLRCGELAAKAIDCAPFSDDRFRQVLRDIRAQTTERFDQIWDDLVSQCASAGVALIFTRELPGTHVSGSARWLSPQKAIIQLSLRYLSDDQLWFAFFHESAHLLLHSKRQSFLRLDDGDKSKIEVEASNWAAAFLIPPQDLRHFIERGIFTNEAIQYFATVLGIAPGIVVGQLQRRDILSYNRGNRLKQRYRWVDSKS